MDSLSPGAQAGVGIGVALGALVAIGIAIFFYLRSRKRKDESSQPAVAEPYNVDSKILPPGHHTVGPYHDGTPSRGRLYEADATGQRFEVDGRQMRTHAELPGQDHLIYEIGPGVRSPVTR